MRTLAAIGISLLVVVAATQAAQPVNININSTRVAIVIDDLGDRLHDGQRVINLPGSVTIGIIPYTPYAKKLAQLAAQQNKEVLLHLPMEAMSDKYLGMGGLSTAMDEQQFSNILARSLAYLPNIRGVNNHMGSRLTQDAEKMNWLMNGLRQFGGLYFLDSRTIDTTQAIQVAQDVGIDHAQRDVFLDHTRDKEKMQRQWRYFIKLAKTKGSAICIAHPYPESLAFLTEKLPELEESDIHLIKVSELIHWREQRSKLVWQTSTSSSP